jgi:magnesium transporter
MSDLPEQDRIDADSADSSLYTEEGHLKPELPRIVAEAIENGDQSDVIDLTAPLHASELADLLEALEPVQRIRLVGLAGDEFDLSSLTEVDEAIRLEIAKSLPVRRLAEAMRSLDSDDAVYILEDLEKKDQGEILAHLPVDERLLIKRALGYPEESAGRRMQTDFIAVPPFWKIGQTIDYMREDKNLPDRFYEIFVVSPKYELLGTVQLDKLLRTGRSASIEDIMEESVHPIDANMDQEEAARIFQQYDLLSAAVVDEGRRLVGVITIDDIVDVIDQEADEDIKRLGGVGDEELSDTVLEITRSRFSWLLVNLCTAIVASVVIGMFDATIQQMVALAVLMPIVASMGGNAGTQTMTVAVRALATRDIDAYNTRRIIRREVLVGLLNGSAFAVLIGLAAGFWYGNLDLGLIIAFAMVFNMLCAALAGILIPIVLQKLHVDPAVASSVFVTTVTDVVGFFAFLGAAAWWFQIG